MDLKKQIDTLADPCPRTAYRCLQELEERSENSSELYAFFDDFFRLMQAEDRYQHLRGYRLLCKQAKWDEKHKIEEIINNLLDALDGSIPVELRQKLKALEGMIPHKPALAEMIKKRVQAIIPAAFPETMAGLIEKDIQAILKTMASLPQKQMAENGTKKEGE